MKTRTETPQKWGWKLRKNPQQKSLWFCCGFAYNFLPLHPVKCRTKSTFFSLRNSDDFGTKRIWKSAISYFFWHRKPIEPQMLFVGRPRIYSVGPPQLRSRRLILVFDFFISLFWSRWVENKWRLTLENFIHHYSNSMKMGYFLIAVGLVCLFAGIILYVNESKAKKNTPTDILVEKRKYISILHRSLQYNQRPLALTKMMNTTRRALNLRSTLYRVSPKSILRLKSGGATSQSMESIPNPAPTPTWNMPSPYTAQPTILP